MDGGEQGGNEVVEEDFDLSDIMGQDVGAGDLTSKEARMQEIDAQLQVRSSPAPHFLQIQSRNVCLTPMVRSMKDIQIANEACNHAGQRR